MENKEKKVTTIFDYVRFMKQCSLRTCTECPVSIFKNEQGKDCRQFLMENPGIYNEILLKWCEEHPEKTFKDDFLEKFPNAWLTGKTPRACRHNIYPCNRESPDNCMYMSCTECWNESYKE